MRILHTSDWHADWKTVGVRRFDEVRAAVWQTVEAAKREQVDLYAMTGDLADPDDGPNVLRAVELALAVASELSVAGIPSVWVAGNHDVVEDGTGLTTLWPLRGIEAHRLKGCAPVYVCELADLLLPASTVFLAGLKIALFALPYPAASAPYDPVERVRAAKTMVEGARVVVLTHLQVEGAALGEETTDMPRGRDVRFPHEECERDWVVLAGHYHKRQTIHRPGCPPVHVVGALARLAFGEQSNTPSFSIVEV
jgi:DNA repair exonuclease SbcCD nuclease subunit